MRHLSGPGILLLTWYMRSMFYYFSLFSKWFVSRYVLIRVSFLLKKQHLIPQKRCRTRTDDATRESKSEMNFVIELTGNLNLHHDYVLYLTEIGSSYWCSIKWCRLQNRKWTYSQSFKARLLVDVYHFFFIFNRNNFWLQKTLIHFCSFSQPLLNNKFIWIRSLSLHTQLHTHTQATMHSMLFA